MSGGWTNVAEDEPVAFDDLAGIDGDRRVETRARSTRTCGTRRPRRTDRLPQEAPRADVRRMPTGDLGRCLSWVDAGDDRPNTAGEHLACERSGWAASRAERHGRSPLPARACSRYARTSVRIQIPEHHLLDTFGSARRIAPAHCFLVDSFGHGAGSSTRWTGRPSRSAWATTSSRRTACIDTRSA